ncbi:MAG: MogA/MoaB family molybdenum cofactor biosynthesis protein [Actinomycetota bacterium]|nr:MogA/MoaB family molybdenum cofactor biosynthesis protein [Actinomycetota bacterium]
MSSLTAAVLTVSNSVAAGTVSDASGPVAVAALEEIGFTVVEAAVVADGIESVSGALVRLAEKARLIVTTGGTGLSPTDVTPEATRSVIDREIPGISEAMRSATFGRVPFGMLSRGVCGLLGECVIVNMPGSPKAVAEGFEVIGSALTHAVDIASGGFGRHD